MHRIFRLVIILIALSNQAFAQTVKIRERSETESHKEAKAASFYTKNQLQLDPMWLIRGTVMVSGERTIGDYLTVRANVGVCFRDYMDGLLVDGPLSGSVNYLSNTPQPAFGLEGRYYYNENASFDSPYIGLGVARRAYQYTTSSSYMINNEYPKSTASSKSLDLYIRYGSTLSIVEWEKSSLLFEYGFSVGFSFDTYSYMDGSGMNSQSTVNRWILPHTGIGFTF
ncbi:MAG: hypothetical protein RLZZ543_1949 [Bacteroidota bacterium]|jgi:hypothetical protein